MNEIDRFIAFVASHNKINDKAKLAELTSKEFKLVKDRSVYYCDEFAVRFSASNGPNFGNTVLSLSNLQKYDSKPFLICLVTPDQNYLMLANTTFLKKISHSSHELREDNIRGSFNGSDIMREFDAGLEGSIKNTPENFPRLFAIHDGLEFEDNLRRLVEATTNIVATGKKVVVEGNSETTILEAPRRAENFVQSSDYATLKSELDAKVEKFKNEIVIAALIENVNVRGRIIEYLIAGEDDQLRGEIIAALKRKDRGIPQFKTDNNLGDYSRDFEKFLTETDVKTKIMVLNSNPKAYNIDKMLEFLASDRSVFMFYFVGVDTTRIVNTVMVSMFEEKLLGATILLRHWAGRNSRGVTQLEGHAIKGLILSPSQEIDLGKAESFLKRLIEL
jgi:hypothetical protein